MLGAQYLEWRISENFWIKAMQVDSSLLIEEAIDDTSK